MPLSLDTANNSAIFADILVVDDVPPNLDFLSTVLTQEGYKVRSAINGQVAIKIAQAAQPDLILLDIKMPGMDGYEVCRLLKANPLTQKIPVIFLSALDQTGDKVKAFGLGGVDYIPKPFQAEELLARVGNHLKLRAAQSEVQKLNTELEQRVIQRTSQLEQEINERLRMQEKIVHMATHNSLTNLPNRVLLAQRLQQVLTQLSLNQNQGLALLLIKFNKLQLVKNSLGHNAVDQLIVAITRRLETVIESGSFLANFGEDTFAILNEASNNQTQILKFAEKLQKEFSYPFYINNHSVYGQTDIGIVLASTQYKQSIHMLRDASTALSQAISDGMGKIEIFKAEMHQRTLSFFEVQNELYRALHNHELTLVYHPIIALADNSLNGLETLVRWNHPQRGYLTAEEFIPIAEETELILQLDRYVLRNACHQLKEWQNHNLLHPSFRLHVNLSAQQLAQRDFIDYLDNILAETQIDHQNLAFEITEYGLMQQTDVFLATLEQLKRYQITVSIDDFGTGYSSLHYLYSLKIENLKIDRSFVHQMNTTKGLKVIQAIINLAHELGMTVTAEGVENSVQLATLETLGCEYMQGYLWGKPTDGPTISAQL
ncbi:EAL domain-containing protein [Leptolyngbya cf. ectocarpi LEGE 11479]|uniref:EAL domain-containing protein n=1 Tax=Leptolyngbya cf. ectocarpi LEGE 11479 TaxID=1828722 RepID=A0A929F9X1_LEPEC|nr:EAL domain-containing protein [Leptolyngbya ectocarpi]MBE9067628.1 EAL domain-containing protein [Leptolyngbya cf. ectocarpi LEGE 11479]